MSIGDPERERDRRLRAVISALPYAIPFGILVALTVVIALVVIGAYTYAWKWTGFLDKTLWEWMKLLVVPIILALGGLLITQMERLNAGRSQQLDRERLTADREQAQDEQRLARERQITDLFTRAINQLGAKDDSGARILEVRVGAIYALERIARDSRRDHWPIMEILTSYVRQYATQLLDADIHSVGRVAPAPDIQAILTILGRRSPDYRDTELGPLDLHDTYLSGANLSGADLSGANLSGARLVEANLSGANLMGADLNSAELWRADLSKANLSDADINLAAFGESNLSGANLKGVEGVPFSMDLTKLNLTGATMPDGQQYEDWLKSKGSGEDGENSRPS